MPVAGLCPTLLRPRLGISCWKPLGRWRATTRYAWACVVSCCAVHAVFFSSAALLCQAASSWLPCGRTSQQSRLSGSLGGSKSVPPVVPCLFPECVPWSQRGAATACPQSTLHVGAQCHQLHSKCGLSVFTTTSGTWLGISGGQACILLALPCPTLALLVPLRHIPELLQTIFERSVARAERASLRFFHSACVPNHLASPGLPGHHPTQVVTGRGRPLGHWKQVCDQARTLNARIGHRT